MYTIIGSRKNYVKNGYKNTKGKLLDGELFENNDERKEIHMIDPAKVKELAKKLSKRCCQGSNRQPKITPKIMN
jgi:hypothetical protein